MFERKIIFKDLFGNKFILYPKKDSMLTYRKRKSITDAVHIMRYIQSLDEELECSIDLGANQGAVSVEMWKKTKKDGNVFSIEADPNNIGRIINNLNCNNLPAHNVVNLAIADSKGTAELKVFNNANGWQTIGEEIGDYAKNRKCKSVKVNKDTLINFINFYDLKNINLIKIDIEGAELMALNSIKSMLQNKQIDKIIFEVNTLTLEPFGESIDTLLDFWKDLPYKLQFIKEDGSLDDISFARDKKMKFYDCLATAIY